MLIQYHILKHFRPPLCHIDYYYIYNSCLYGVGTGASPTSLCSKSPSTALLGSPWQSETPTQKQEDTILPRSGTFKVRRYDNQKILTISIPIAVLIEQEESQRRSSNRPSSTGVYSPKEVHHSRARSMFPFFSLPLRVSSLSCG
jgi:hypothetical protein